jgi:hypothetical protein
MDNMIWTAGEQTFPEGEQLSGKKKNSHLFATEMREALLLALEVIFTLCNIFTMT